MSIWKYVNIIVYSLYLPQLRDNILMSFLSLSLISSLIPMKTNTIFSNWPIIWKKTTTLISGSDQNEPTLHKYSYSSREFGKYWVITLRWLELRLSYDWGQFRINKIQNKVFPSVKWFWPFISGWCFKNLMSHKSFPKTGNLTGKNQVKKNHWVNKILWLVLKIDWY